MVELLEFIKMPKMQGVRSNTPVLSEDPQKVFVYGTLKKGYGNHIHLADAQECGTASLEGIMFHLGGFPAINIDEELSILTGEVYQTDWEHIFRMDQLEGVGHRFYDRVQVKVKPHGTVWTYVFSRERVTEYGDRCGWIIPSGIWRGPLTPKVKWSGFGEGFEVGAFETHPESNIIKVGSGKGDFQIKKDNPTGEYLLIQKAEGTVLGRYKHIRDFMQNSKPTIRLKPDLKVVVEPPITNHPTVREIVESRVRGGREQQHPGMPLLLEGGNNKQVVVVEKPAEVKVPQAMRLLQMKYGAA